MSEDRTRIISRPGTSVRKPSESIPQTERIDGERPAKVQARTTDPDPETRLFRPKKSATAATTPHDTDIAQKPESATNRMHDPVVGWLVVIDGPGKGYARELGYGMNAIGRSPENRVSLDFGDPEISRHSHVVVTYDPRGRRFYAQHGDGVNLSYLDDHPLLQPTELKSGEILSFGNTRLKFIALCGTEFDWENL